MSSQRRGLGRPVLLAAETALTRPDSEGTGQLARFFRDVERVQRIAFLSLERAGGAQVRETVLVEFAGATKAIFTSAFPLEFGDSICLANEAGNQAEANVIAVQYRDGRTAVAAEFLSGPFSWVKRP